MTDVAKAIGVWATMNWEKDRGYPTVAACAMASTHRSTWCAKPSAYTIGYLSRRRSKAIRQNSGSCMMARDVDAGSTWAKEKHPIMSVASAIFAALAALFRLISARVPLFDSHAKNMADPGSQQSKARVVRLHGRYSR
jgi:hypothetical protein